jgi:hypothetical protein
MEERKEATEHQMSFLQQGCFYSVTTELCKKLRIFRAMDEAVQ